MIGRARYFACRWSLIAALISASLGAQAYGAVKQLEGWREAVINTSNASAWIALLTSVGQWQVIATGTVDKGLLDLWHLDSAVTGKQTLLGNPGTDRGYIRLIELQGAEQSLIRANDRPWDTGGHFDINIRVLGLRALQAQLNTQGWHGDSEPSQFRFGPFEVIEWIARGPDGVRVAFSERLAPELEGYPHLRGFSRTFNATQTVADMPGALAFYRDVLGMEIYLEHEGASAVEGPNVLGLPFETTASVARTVYVLHPRAVNEGSVELLSFNGASGRDLSAHAKPANLGITALRFEVSDLNALRVELAKRGHPLSQFVDTTLPPYGNVKIGTLTSPEGARLEFYEVRNSD